MIVLFDIETAPTLGYVWGKYEQDVIAVQDDWFILCFAYKELGKSKVHAHSLPDFKEYSKDKKNDYHVVKKLWEVFDKATFLVAHNGDQFDIKKANARFIAHGFPPPSPYRTIDTRKLAKKYFRFDSNKLDDLCKYLNLGRKQVTTGFRLWQDCMEGVEGAWKQMVKYNKQDVKLLEEIYLLFRSWHETHPSTTEVDEQDPKCPKCGSMKIQKRGWSGTASNFSKYRRFQCQECFGWSRGRSIKTKVIIR